MTDLLRPTPQFQRPRPPVKARRSTAFHVAAIGAVAYLGAALLNSGHLARAAQRQPFGARRDLYLAALRPLDRVIRTLHLDVPARALSDIRGEHNAAVRGAASNPPSVAIKPFPAP